MVHNNRDSRGRILARIVSDSTQWPSTLCQRIRTRSLFDCSNSPYAASADFAKYVMELRDEAFLKVAPIRQIRRLPWKDNHCDKRYFDLAKSRR